MVGALVVTVLVILGFVAFRAFNRSQLEVRPDRVDYLSEVRFAQQAGADVVYPASLPTGWYATRVSFSSERPAQLTLSMLTGHGDYVGFAQSRATLGEALTDYVDAHPQAGAPVQVDGSVVPTWSRWTDAGGDTALAATRGGQTLLVFGTASEGEIEQLAASLTAAPVAG
jgi:Protein of unknown function (DUF4245)